MTSIKEKYYHFYDIIYLNSINLIIVFQLTRVRYIQYPRKAQNNFEKLHQIISQKWSLPSINLDHFSQRKYNWSQIIVGAHVVLYQRSGQHLTNRRVVLFRLSPHTTWEVKKCIFYKTESTEKVNVWLQ